MNIFSKRNIFVNFRASFVLLGLFFAMAQLAAMDLNALLIRGKSVTAAKYKDADYVLLYDRQIVTYQLSGAYVDNDDYYCKVLTEKGRRQLRTISLGFNPVYGTVAVSKLELIRDGRVIPVDVKANSRIAVEAGQMSSNIYDPNNKTLHVAIPDLRIDDIIHYVVENKITKPRIPNVWCDIFSLQSTQPILEYIVCINAPASMPLKSIAIKDNAGNTVRFKEEKSTDRIIYTWEAGNVPQVFPEPDMPSLYTCAQRLLVSTVSDWREISGWYYKLCRPRLDAVTPEMRTHVQKLLKDVNRPEEKIMRLFQFVSQNIRYMGITPEKEAPGYEPHDVSLTFKNRYGVCRDKAALLVSLLEIAGIKAYPVLFMAGPRKDQEVPNNYFNHAVVAAELPTSDGGKNTASGHSRYILMDPTFETTTELLPSALAGMSYLVAKKDGETLLTSPPVPVEKNMLSVRGSGVLSRDGVLNYSAVIDFAGVNDQVYRDAFSRWPHEHRRQFFAAKVKSAFAGAELKELTVLPEDIRDMTKPLQVKLSFVADFPLPDGIFTFSGVTLGLSGELGIAGSVLGGMELDERKFPLEIYSSCGVQEYSKIIMPQGVVSAATPREFLEVNSPGFVARQKSEFVNGALVSEGEFRIDRTLLSPLEYKQLKSALRRLAMLKCELPLFRSDAKISDLAATFPQSDSALLLWDQRDFYTASGVLETESRIRRKILTYAGIKKFSELKLSYNPAVSTVKVKDCVVIDSDGKRHPLTAKEINVMDAAWCGSAPRYPAGKILVVNFPGVKAGAVIEYTVIRRDTAPYGAKSDVVAGSNSPIIEMRYSIASQPGAKVLYNAALATRKDIRRHNIPPVPHEPGTPDGVLFLPSLRSSNGDFAAFAAKLSAQLLKLSTGQPAAEAMARKLCAGKKNEREIIRTIRDFLAVNIRHAGPSFSELPPTALSAADRTLADGYGNSADRAILLRAMLDALGIKTSFIVVSDAPDTPGNRKLLMDIPSTAAFCNVLLRTTCDGEVIYLNDGDQYSALGTSSFEGFLAYDLADKRAFRLTVPQMTVEKAFHMDIILADNGDAQLKITEKFFGTIYGAEKRRFSEFTPEKLKRYTQSLVSSVSQAAEPEGNLQIDFDGYPGVLRYTVKIPAFAPRRGDLRQLALPFFSNVSAPLRTMESARRNPYELNGNIEYRFGWRVTYPSHWSVVALPSDFNRENSCLKADVRYAERKNSVSCTAEIERRSGIVSPVEYREMARLQSILNKEQLRTIIFREESVKRR